MENFFVENCMVCKFEIQYFYYQTFCSKDTLLKTVKDLYWNFGAKLQFGVLKTILTFSLLLMLVRLSIS